MLVKQHADVNVIMTHNATNFINPITFETLTGNKCLVDTFDRNFEFNVEHVALAKRADIFMVAPASANVIGKMANGIADDMLTTTILAAKCPKLISPAMNTNMYENRIVQDNIKKLLTSKHSRLPVCDGSLDDVKGLCSTRYLLQQIVDTGKVDFTAHMIPIVYVPESLTGLELLDNFKKNDVPLAVVVDEYGSGQGIVSPRDVLEAIVGEFKNVPGEEDWAIKREDGSLLVDGMMPVPELKDQLNLKALPNEADGRYNTLAGMIIWMTGHLPRTGDVVTWDNWRFEVVDMDGRRIDKVLVSSIEEKDEQSETEK